MTEEEVWRVCGLTQQVWTIQQSLIEVLASQKLTDTRIRDLKHGLLHIVEQVEHLREVA